MQLVEFLTKVVSDEAWRRRFCESPRRAIERAELSEAAQEAIKSGDPRHLAFVICVAEAPPSRRFDPID